MEGDGEEKGETEGEGGSSGTPSNVEWNSGYSVFSHLMLIGFCRQGFMIHLIDLRELLTTRIMAYTNQSQR